MRSSAEEVQLLLLSNGARSAVEFDEQHVAGAHPEFLGHEVVQASSEQARAGEQHDRQRRLDEEERLARASDPARASRRARKIGVPQAPGHLRDARGRGDNQDDDARERGSRESPEGQPGAVDDRGQEHTPYCFIEPVREQERHADGRRREERGFDDGLLDQPAARGAESGSDREIPPACGAANEKQGRAVGEADDEHQHRDASQPIGDALLGCRHVSTADWRQGDASVLSLDRGACLRGRRCRSLALLQADHDGRDVAEGVAVPAGHLAHGRVKRHPDVHAHRRVPAEAGRHDPGDCEVHAPDRHAAAEHRGVAAERSHPERVAQHGNGGSRGARRRPAECRARDAAGRPAAGRYEPETSIASAPICAPSTTALVVIRCQAAASAIIVNPFTNGFERDVRRGRHPRDCAVVRFVLEGEREHAACFRHVRGRAEKGAVDEAEHGEVEADGDGERQHRGRGGPRRAAEDAKRQPAIETKGLGHWSSSLHLFPRHDDWFHYSRGARPSAGPFFRTIIRIRS